MECASDTVKLKLIDGSERDVLIRKYLPFRKKQQILMGLFDGLKVDSKNSKGP